MIKYFKKHFCKIEGKKGIFGLNCFANKKNLADSTLNTLNKCNSIVDSYISMKNDTNLIEIIDYISNECCTLIDGATALYHLHPEEEMKNEAFRTILNVGNFFDNLNRNKKFYNKSLDFYFSEYFTSWDFMNSEFRQILEKNVEELAFYNKNNEHSFSHPNQILDEDELIDNINECKVYNLRENYSEIIENLTNEYKSPSDIKYDFRISENEIKGLSSQILKTILQVYVKNSPVECVDESSGIISGKQKSAIPNTIYNLKADFDLLNTIIKKSNNLELSIKAYSTISATFGSENFPKMLEILKYRLKFAKELGYQSFSEYQLNNQTLKIKPEILISILKEMWINLRPNLIMDLKYLLTEENGEISNYLLNPDNIYLMPFQIDSLRSSYVDKYLKTIDEKNITRRYITIGNLLDGLSILTKTLFKKDLYLVMDEDELNEEMLHESVLLTYLKDKDEIKAKIYFDFFKREGKFQDVFSQFTIQGSKTLNKYNYKFKQIPKVVLATNFEVTDLNLLNMQISYSDAKNIFHEYGHVLHSVLSKTDFQSLSGNRIPLDFAEIPSHLMEYFLYDYSFCKLWMVDKKSNEKMDKNLHSLCSMQSRIFSNLDLQETIYNSLFDLEIHSFKSEEEITTNNIMKIHQNLIKNYFISSIFAVKKENFSKFEEILKKYNNKINVKFPIDNFYQRIIGKNYSSEYGKIDKDNNRMFIEEIQELIDQSSFDKNFIELKNKRQKFYESDFIFTTIPHFKNYPSNYYTYIIGKVFANLIWTQSLSTNKNFEYLGKLLEEQYLSKGFTDCPQNLIENLFNKFK